MTPKHYLTKTVRKIVGKSWLIITIIGYFMLLSCESRNEEYIPISTITLSVDKVNLSVGETMQLKAQISPSNATDQAVLWGSSKPSVASVSATGMVTAMGEGRATIKASSGGLSASCEVNVNKAFVSVESVSLDKGDIVLIEGQSAQLAVAVLPEDATDKSVMWSTTNSSIAVVDEHGLVTAISSGTTDVVVVTIDGAKKATCNVTVQEKDTENGHKWVDLGLPSGLKWATCNVGANAPEEYGDYFAWGETEPYYNPGHSQDDPCSNWKDGKSAGYYWTSYKWRNDTYGSLTKYNTRSSYGTVDNKTALEMADDAARQVLGGSWRMPTDAEWTELRTKCTWNWTTRNGINGRLVNGPNGNSIFLPAAGYRQLTNIYEVGSYGIYWSSSLNTEDLFNARDVFFYSDEVCRNDNDRYDGFSVRPVIGDGIKVAVTSVSLSKSSLSLIVGETETLTATVKPDDATDKTVEWTSSNSNIAKVDAAGKVTAVKEGTATITALAGSITATCSVTVRDKEIPVSSITLNKTTLSLEKNKTETLVATVSPDNAADKTVTWSTSDKSVATVSDGTVTAKKSGTATITARAGDKTATCTVTVTTPVTSITLNKASISLVEEQYATLTAMVSPNDADDKTVSWTSSSIAIATVDNNGKVTAVKEGAATITAQAGGKTATCTVTVQKKVIPVTSITLNKTALSLIKDQTETLIATVKPDDATDKTVNWSSSDASIASVDANGKVTGVKEGTVTITAKASDKEATCQVTVKPEGTPSGGLEGTGEEDVN